MEEDRSGLLKRVLYGNYITAAIRIVMGSLLVFSGFFKVLDIESFGNVIAMYDLAPPWSIPYAAFTLPVLEIAIGMFIALGIRIQASSLIAAVLMVFFAVIIAISVARGQTFECGCFELNRLGIGIDERVSLSLVARDIVFAALYLLIMTAKNNMLSLERVLERLRLRYL
jgi:uncharacterized membrane protein YphA (DoxX/SURF4 family)